jgi:hypothetical protein
MVRYVPHKNINKTRWDEAVESAVNSYVYACSWYLDIATGNQWDALIKDDYEMVMPLPYSRKFGIYYIHMPILTQQLGIFYKTSCSNLDIFEFLRSTPKKFKLVEQNFNKFLYGRIPAQFVVRENVNYELELLGDYAAIRNGYSKNLKRNLKKAEKNNLKIINNVKPETVVEMFSQNKGQVIKAWGEKDYNLIIRIMHMLMHKGRGEINGVIDEKNNIIGAAFFVRSKGRQILLFTGLTESGKEKGALWISARISSTRHTVIRGPSFTGFGKRPDLTPAHQVLFDIGIIAGIGELLVESPMILGNRTKPVSGKGVVVDLLGSMKFSPGVVNNDR